MLNSHFLTSRVYISVDFKLFRTIFAEFLTEKIGNFKKLNSVIIDEAKIKFGKIGVHSFWFGQLYATLLYNDK
jgi:hypothetical protein